MEVLTRWSQRWRENMKLPESKGSSWFYQEHLQVILFEIDCAIVYTNLHELFCQSNSWTNWVNSGKFMDNCWKSCQVMPDMDYHIIINLYYATLIEGVPLARYHLLPLKFRASPQYTFRAPHFDFRTVKFYWFCHSILFWSLKFTA